MSFLSHGFGRLKDLADIPSTAGNEFKYLGLDGAGNPKWDTPAGGGGGGSGDVVGPASATDNAVARFDTTTGKLIQNSSVTIDDSGNIVTTGTVDGRDVSVDGAKLDGVATGATANSSDATLLNRANHTGTQVASTISDFSAAVAATASVTANTAKVTNQTHTGDVTGATALTIQGSAITSKTVVTPVGADYILISDTSNGGAAAAALISSLPSGGGGISEELAIAYAVAL